MHFVKLSKQRYARQLSGTSKSNQDFKKIVSFVRILLTRFFGVVVLYQHRELFPIRLGLVSICVLQLPNSQVDQIKKYQVIVVC